MECLRFRPYLHTHKKQFRYDTFAPSTTDEDEPSLCTHIFFINLKHNQYVTPFCVFTHNEKGIEMKLR